MSRQMTNSDRRLGETLGNQHQMGSLLASRRPHTVATIAGLIVFFLLFVLLMDVPLWLGTRSFVNGPAGFMDLFRMNTIGIVMALTVVLLMAVWGNFVLLPGLILQAIQAYRNRNHRLFVYEHGLIDIGHHAQPIRVIRWPEVEELRHKIIPGGENGDTDIFTITLIDGTRFQNLMDIELWRGIETATFNHLFAKAWNTYQASQSVSFGPLLVTNQGLLYQSTFVAWSAIESIHRWGAKLAVKEHGRSPKQARIFEEIPNLAVFMRLGERIRPGIQISY